MSDVTVISNYIPRPVVYGYELPASAREEFDYVDWDKVENGEDNPSFILYRGDYYDLGEFDSTAAMGHRPEWIEGKWDGVQTQSAFSAILIRFTNNYESVIMGRAHW